MNAPVTTTGLTSPAAKDVLVRNGERGAEFFVKAGPAAESLILKYGDDILRIFEFLLLLLSHFLLKHKLQILQIFYR